MYQFSTLPAALGDANAIVVATGASDRVDPLGPFNIDYEVKRGAVVMRGERCYCRSI